jgi:hypothetical protein
VSFTTYQAITARKAYESTMNGGSLGSVIPGAVLSVPLSAMPLDGAGSRVVTLGLVPPTVGRDPDRLAIRRSGVYPLLVELRDADDHPVANFRTPLVVGEADGRPTVNTQLELAWVWPITAPPSFLPSGESDHDVLAAMRPDGRLGRQAAALRTAPDIPVTLAPTGETLDAWNAFGRDDVSVQSGSDAVRTVSPNHQIVDGTYVPVDLPSLVDHGLSAAVDETLQRGTQLLQNAYGPALDLRTRLVRPASAGALSRLAAVGTDRVVIDSTALAPPANEPRLTPAQPVNVRVAGAGTTPTVAALTTEPGLQTFLAADLPAPLRAQLVLGDLAVVAQEQPSLSRVITLVNPDNFDAPSSLFTALLDGLRANPYVRPVTVNEAFETVAPENGTGNTAAERELAPTATSEPLVSGSAYDAERTRLTAFNALTQAGNPAAVGTADRSLLASVSSAWPPDAGRARAAAHLQVVDHVIGQFVGLIEVPNTRTITLTSRSGEIPLTFRNGTGDTVHVRAALSSEKLFFPQGTVLDLWLPPRSTTVRVAVETRTSGTFPLDLEVTSTDGVLPISQRRLEVRSTFVSTVGVVLMVSAALFLAAWWGLDLRRRRRRRAQPTAS